MNHKSPIYTEKNNCQDCYKCLRQCPVKAIKVEDSSASIIPEACIYCGHCVQVCPVGAKKVRYDLLKVIRLLQSNHKVIACLAPSYISDFPDLDPALLVNALKRLGFYGVSETAIGAELVALDTAKWLNEQPQGVYISSCCTSLVQLINRHYPQLSDHLVPVLSPMQAQAKMLKENYGPDVMTVFFGPCIAKKSECDEVQGLMDYAITFRGLYEWLNVELPGWEKAPIENSKLFIPYAAGKGSFFPVDGGMIANLKDRASLTDTSYMSFSGINNIKEVLQDIAGWKVNDKVFLELLICEGGCVKGPGTINSASVAVKRQRILGSVKNHRLARQSMQSHVDIHCNHEKPAGMPVDMFSEQDIVKALRSSGKFNKADELNCGGCGYDSCRDFARAMMQGKAERIMCVTYIRKVAQDKASVLLKKMPYGVVIADENLKIIDSNRKFAELLGGETMDLYESIGNLDGADLRKLLFFHKFFTAVIHTGEEMIEHRIRGNGKFFHVSIVTIQPNKIVCGIIQDMQDPDMRNGVVLSSVKQVIRQNMEVVQKIAYLLGENASYTESMLNSIVESVAPDNDHEQPKTN
jgi:iron only hydrogenase large subunit-like protein